MSKCKPYQSIYSKTNPQMNCGRRATQTTADEAPVWHETPPVMLSM